MIQSSVIGEERMMTTDEVREQRDSIDAYRSTHMSTDSRLSIRIDVEEETGDQQIISITSTEHLEPAVMIGIMEMAKVQIIDSVCSERALGHASHDR